MYTCTLDFGRCVQGSGFLADPDPDSGKKSLIRIRKKTGSETLVQDKMKLKILHIFHKYNFKICTLLR